MAEEEAKLMGLTLMDDPETLANPPRDIRAKYLYDQNSIEDWGSSVSEDDDDDEDDTELEQFNLETGGLTDREIDQLDNKTSSRLGQSKKTSSSPTSSSGVNTAKYPERESGANTGPKGVLADQKYHQQQQLQEQLSSRQAYNARMLAKAPTTTTYREDQMRMLQEKKAQGLLDSDDEAKLKAELGDEDALDKLLNNDEDEKTVLERIRSNRLKDMSASWASKPGGGGGGGLVGKKMFGSLMEMNAAQYVSAIDGEKKDVTVVIHIYSEVGLVLCWLSCLHWFQEPFL